LSLRHRLLPSLCAAAPGDACWRLPRRLRFSPLGGLPRAHAWRRARRWNGWLGDGHSPAH